MGRYINWKSQSAFAGYGLEGRGWDEVNECWTKSQSAFAGYGLEARGAICTPECYSGIAIHYHWILDGSMGANLYAGMLFRHRNPLSLDMEWKHGGQFVRRNVIPASQSAFAGYRLEDILFLGNHEGRPNRSQSAITGNGMEAWGAICTPECYSGIAIRFRWIWNGRAPGGRPRGSPQQGRNPLSLDMGWKLEADELGPN